LTSTSLLPNIVVQHFCDFADLLLLMLRKMLIMSLERARIKRITRWLRGWRGNRDQRRFLSTLFRFVV